MILRKDKLMNDPGSVFESPTQVLQYPDLSVEQKAEILTQWKQEAIQRQVAEEENMAGDAADAGLIQDISNALLLLDKDGSTDSPAKV